MSIPNAREMSDAIRGLSKVLHERKIIDGISLYSFGEACDALKEFGKRRTWSYSIGAARPVRFKICSDGELDSLTPNLYLTLSVDENLLSSDRPPFAEMVSVIEVKNESGEMQSRFHIDLANKNGADYQDGPLYHLQFGGHSPGSDRTLEYKAQLPRLSFPPMDLILMCEMVVANYYPSEWDVLRGRKSWVEFIKAGQKLCYSKYMDKVHRVVNGGGSHTVLSSIWANEWG